MKLRVYADATTWIVTPELLQPPAAAVHGPARCLGCVDLDQFPLSWREPIEQALDKQFYEVVPAWLVDQIALRIEAD